METIDATVEWVVGIMVCIIIALCYIAFAGYALKKEDERKLRYWQLALFALLYTILVFAGIAIYFIFAD